jgi:hypothetical protein
MAKSPIKSFKITNSQEDYTKYKLLHCTRYIVFQSPLLSENSNYFDNSNISIQNTADALLIIENSIHLPSISLFMAKARL